MKRRAAINAFQWVVVQQEQNTGLIDQVNDFLILIGYKLVPAAEGSGEVTPFDESLNEAHFEIESLPERAARRRRGPRDAKVSWLRGGTLAGGGGDEVE